VLDSLQQLPSSLPFLEDGHPPLRSHDLAAHTVDSTVFTWCARVLRDILAVLFLAGLATAVFVGVNIGGSSTGGPSGGS
jgi:hypothetical protein